MDTSDSYDDDSDSDADLWDGPLDRLCSLPAVVRQKVLSYLEWGDKLHAAQSIPGWFEDLESSMSWKWVEFLEWRMGLPDGFNAALVDELLKQKECIAKYGKYFQHCCIALSVFDVQQGSYGVELLNQLTANCSILKSLRIYHQFMFCTFEGKWEDYLVPLKKLCTECKQLKYVQLCRLDDCPQNRATKKCKVFEVMQELDLSQKIDLLEFTLDDHCPRPVTDLVCFRNMKTLKIELSNITTSMVQTLVSYQLCNLHVIKDGTTHRWKTPPIIWSKINEGKRKLSVHYIFDAVMVTQSDFIQNPFLESITFVRISCGISRDVIRSIAAMYSNSLTTFVHFSMRHVTVPPYEDMESLPCDYYFFASQCIHLHTFIASIPLPCEAVWCLSMKATKLRNLVIENTQLLYKYRICLPVRTLPREGSLDNEEALRKEVTYWLGHNWYPLGNEEMCDKTERLMEL